MPTHLSSARFEMSARPGQQPQATEREPQGRFNIVVLGDFTGRANRGIAEPLSTRKLLNVDVDNFARAFGQLGAALKLGGPGIPSGTVALAFASLDDFHPDKLLLQVSSLVKLTEARRLVLNPATAEQGRAALQAALGAPTETSTPPSSSAPEADDTMARLLGGALPAAMKTAAPSSPLEQFIRQTVAPHISAAPGAWQSGAMAAVEMELAQRLNAILHHPDFQALEAAWRGVDMLLRRIESSEDIGVLLLDVTLAELQADLAANDSPALFRLLRDREPALLIGNFTFCQCADDLRALGHLAEMAAQLAAPFVATAAPQLMGCDSFALHPDPDDWKITLPADLAEIWQSLRQSPHANRIGLAAPRFMLRQPHGKAGDPIESFPFEELPGEPAHESFLWGHPAILCAAVVIDAIQSGDTALEEFTGGEIGDLPVHKFTEAGEKAVKSYAEAWLTDRAVDRILTSGVIPVVPVKNQNAIRLFSVPSINSRPTQLDFSRSGE